ncbi:MAG: PQQ-dependent sugar dehydrogenase [Candidatus Sumerlaeia bacterium]|nr:PQQ-dependent sugar dehydrogenase [Candidatus Sumerlaeia bacterium]
MPFLKRGLALFSISVLATTALFARVPNTDLRINSLPSPDPGTIITERRYSSISVGIDDYMVEMLPVPDGTNRLVLVQKNGLIRIFPDRDDVEIHEVEVLLDLEGETCTERESGLYSIEFDPEYTTNGHFYVIWVPMDSRCSSYNPSGTWRLSRFTNNDPTGVEVDRSSEVVLVEEPQRHFFHKGGAMEFGPDGYLYASLGDGSHEPSSQDLSNLKGSIIRIDVTSPPDPGLPYAIPPDNPFIDTPGARPEIFAYGFRNPWRMSFDKVTGHLYAGDVGADRYEELNVVLPGANYGWPYFEALRCISPDESLCSSIHHEEPVYHYRHFGGYIAIVGGLNYLSDDIPQLTGRWLFADVAGRLFSIHDDGDDPFHVNTLNYDVGFMITGFGQNHRGEAMLLQAFDNENGIHGLVVSTDSAPNDFPWRLSDLPAFHLAGDGRGEEVPGVMPYVPTSQLWSDGSLKERYLALPGTETMEFSADDHWEFPEETILIKNFLLPKDDRDPEGSAVRIETRLMLKLDSEWHGFSYEWNEEETDATLLTDGKLREFERIDQNGQSYSYRWQYPSGTDCMACHTAAAGRVLGVNTAQLNKYVTQPGESILSNQLHSMEDAGLFSQPLPESPEYLPHMPDYRDETVELEVRVAAYLAANCAMCHQPQAPAPTTIDLSWGADMIEQLMGVEPTRGNLGISGAEIVRAALPGRSVLLHRMETLNEESRMPPLSSSLVDEKGVKLIHDWILSLDVYTSNHSWALYE